MIEAEKIYDCMDKNKNYSLEELINNIELSPSQIKYGLNFLIKRKKIKINKTKDISNYKKI